MKKVAWYTTLVLLTLTALVLVWQFREALILFLLSLVIASAFHPLIRFLVERKVPRGIALVASYVIIFALVAGLVWLIVGPLIRDIEQLSNQVAIDYEQTHDLWLKNGSLLQKTIAGMVPPPQELFVNIGNDGGNGFLQGLMSTTTNLVGVLSSLGLVIILSLYWTADRLHFERLLLSLIPVDQRTKVRKIWRGVEGGVGAYFRSEIAQSILAGFLLWLGYRLMGLPYPVLLAVLGAIAWLIPWFGALIAMIPPFLVGISMSLPLGIIAPLYTLIILVIQEFLIEPRIFRRKSYSSLILVVVILVLTDAFGLVGFLIAPLVSATIQNIIKYLVQPPVAVVVETASPASSAPVITTDLLKERLGRAREVMAEDEPEPSLSIVNLVDRLDNLIVESEQYLNDHNDGDGAAQKLVSGNGRSAIHNNPKNPG